MHCPVCADDLPEDVLRCPECGAELAREPVPFRGQLTAPGFDADEPVELFWTADPRFLVDAASRLKSASIPFITDGAESLNPAAQGTEDDPPEPTVARLFVPAGRVDEAGSVLQEADLDPGESTAGLKVGPDLEIETYEPEDDGSLLFEMLGSLEFLGMLAVVLALLWICLTS